jgi:peptide chain release factor 1
MWPVLDEKLQRFTALERQLEDPVISANPVQATAVARELGSLRKLVVPYQQHISLTKQIRESQELLKAESDPAMRELIEAELEELQPKLDALTQQLEEQLLVDPSEDFDRLILEIRGGVGGDEAALFAGDLFEMYTRYARTKNWQVEIINESPGEAGGYKEISLSIKGDGCYQLLRFESGGHRVQRVPKTETQGRIHTSIATVGVLPEPEEAQVEIKQSDLEIETMRAGGAGGQHVNKTESAVRIWYKRGTADEIEVKCQDGRSQHKNKDQAMRVLRSRVFEMQQRKLHKERSDMRRTLIGGGDRNERIRTYNYPDGRVTDHRIGLTVYKIQDILAGEVDHLIQPMLDHDRKERLAAAGK